MTLNKVTTVVYQSLSLALAAPSRKQVSLYYSQATPGPPYGPLILGKNHCTDLHSVFSDGSAVNVLTVTPGLLVLLSPFGFCMTPHTSTGRRTHLAIPKLHLPPRSPQPDVLQSAQGQQEPLEPGNSPTYLVISGGTGCNSICAAFAQSACYILPVSDNGGSSSEIIRVLGGPSIG